jgi:hypothetical protein
VEAIRVRWDESAYVSPDGVAQGRLIRGKTKRGNIDREQPPTPVPPGASIAEWCLPEAHAEGFDAAGALQVFSLEPDVTGRMFLALESVRGPESWQGEVRSSSPATSE